MERRDEGEIQEKIMQLDIMLMAFSLPLIAFSFLGYLVVKYKQNVRPFIYILSFFVILNVIHFSYGIFSPATALVWLAVINLEAFALLIFALMGYRKLKNARK